MTSTPTAATLAAHPDHPSMALDLAPPIGTAVVQAPGRRKLSPWLLGAASAVVTLVLAGLAWLLLGVSRMEVTDVVTLAPLVGNGRPQPLQLRCSGCGADVRAIDVRFVRGDGAYNPVSWSVPVSGATRDLGVFDAGTLSPVAAAAQRMTFEFSMVGKDGHRSAPFEKTFEIVPPARITQLSAPARLTVGQTLPVTLAYRRGNSEIVQVLRRVVQSDVSWEAQEQSLPLRLTQAEGQQQLQLTVPPLAQNSTLEVVLVDAAGIHSEPARLSFSVGNAGPAVAFGTVVKVSHLGGAGGMGAVGGAVAGGVIGNRFGRGGGRAAMTALGAIGGAFAGHQIESNVRGSSEWETTVQIDGGGLRRIRHGSAPRWQVGSRVRVAGNSIQG